MFNMYLSYYVSYTCVNTFILTGKIYLAIENAGAALFEQNCNTAIDRTYNNFIINTYYYI